MINDLRAALVDLVNVDHTYSVQPAAPEAPCAVVEFPQVNHLPEFGTGKSYVFPVTLYVAANDVEAAQREMGDLVDGLTSLITEEGPWEGLRLIQSEPLVAVTIGSQAFLTVTSTVEVFT